MESDDDDLIDFGCSDDDAMSDHGINHFINKNQIPQMIFLKQSFIYYRFRFIWHWIYITQKKLLYEQTRLRQRYRVSWIIIGVR